MNRLFSSFSPVICHHNRNYFGSFCIIRSVISYTIGRCERGVSMSQVEQNMQQNEEQQLSILNRSSYYVFIVAIAIFLSIETLDLQRDQLLCSADGNNDCGSSQDLLPLQFTSSALTLLSTTYFYRLAKQIYSTSSDEASQLKNKFNYASSYLVFIASIIRLLNLLMKD